MLLDFRTLCVDGVGEGGGDDGEGGGGGASGGGGKSGGDVGVVVGVPGCHVELLKWWKLLSIMNIL